MRAEEFENPKEKFVDMFQKFLPLAMEIIGLRSLPTFEFENNLDTGSQPSFGMYSVDNKTLYIALANRHPNDILRTVAHELVHYKQDTEHELNDESGATGSPEENEANQVAGIVMRNFNKRYPEFLKSKPVVNESAGDKGDIPTGPQQQLIPFPKGTTMVDVSDVYDWYKLGMVISDLDDADPKIFGQGAPHTVIAFGSEEEESKLLPLLKRLGLSVHDIDRPEDVKKAIPAKMLAKDLAETIRKVGSQYRLVSKSGKNLGTYPTHAGAEKRERQVQYFKHMKESLIDEAQNFDFDTNKPTILKFIANVLNNQPNNRQYNPFYSLIVGDPKIGGAGKLGLPDQFAASWKKYFQNPAFVGGAPEPWSQVNIGDKFAKATGDDRTLNFYITLDKEKNNIIKFLNNLHKLGSYLQPISNQYQTPIKFKTHSLLDSFIGHNDSLKVYYYDPQVKDLVVNATKKWLSDSGIVTGTRSHEHGVDVKSGGGSFGQILSNHVYDTFTKLIQTQGKKYTPEQYFEWLKQHLPSLIQQVKQKEVAENFADGKNPQDKGDSARHGIKKGMSIAQLKKVRSSDSASSRKKQLAHWQINMRQGRKK